MSENSIAGVVASPLNVGGERNFLGHPRALVVLAGTELWDRISFHGMQALLVLYMVDQLLLPGHIEHISGFAGFRHVVESVTGPLSTQALASQTFGLYVGLAYFTPFFGGLLGDRVLGRRRAVTLGALLMALGHFCMAFEQSFLLALLLLVLGAGLLRGNLASQVGGLYSKNDRRRADAFQVYYVMLNTGAFVAPLITGVLAQNYGWQYGFGFAGFGMLAGLIIYISGRKLVPADEVRAAERPKVRLEASDRRVLYVLIAVLPVLALFWVAQAQIWNTYNLWARDHLNLTIAGWQMPVPWLQSIDSLAVIVMAPPILLLWRSQARRTHEPDELRKLGIGCLIFAASTIWLAEGARFLDPIGRVPLPWALVFHLASNVGYVYFAPTAVALFSRAAPAAINSMMIGAYYLAMFAGITVSGRLGGLYEQLTPERFWMLHALIVGAGGIALLALARPIRRAIGTQAQA